MRNRYASHEGDQADNEKMDRWCEPDKAFIDGPSRLAVKPFENDIPVVTLRPYTTKLDLAPKRSIAGGT